LVEIVGLVGLVILVVVFLLQGMHLFRGKKEIYFYSFNALGAGLLATYALSLSNIYFTILESVWCAGALVSGFFMFRKVFWNHQSIVEQSESS
jgi:hypothetical protein